MEKTIATKLELEKTLFGRIKRDNDDDDDDDDDERSFFFRILFSFGRILLLI